MTASIDTNVLIAVINPDEPHHQWAMDALNDQKALGPALISDIVFCEFSITMKDLNEVSDTVNNLGLERLRISDQALFRAGEAYKAYRMTKGNKTNVLPDFLIGAEATVLGVPLVTANAKDFTAYFPDLKIISP